MAHVCVSVILLSHNVNGVSAGGTGQMGTGVSGDLWGGVGGLGGASITKMQCVE